MGQSKRICFNRN